MRQHPGTPPWPSRSTLVIVLCVGPVTAGWAAASFAQPPRENPVDPDPLVIATGNASNTVTVVREPPPPPPPPPPPRPTPVSEPKTEGFDWLVAGGVGPMAPAAFGLRAGAYERTYVGVSFATSTGRIFRVDPERSGLMLELGWQFAFIEVPLTVYRTEMAAMAGYRLRLDGGHGLYAVGGVQGQGGAALKLFHPYLRFPQGSAGYLWTDGRGAFQLGGVAALDMVGKLAVGEAAQLSMDPEYDLDHYAVSYSLRPHAGARGTAIFKPIAVYAEAGRTSLAGGNDGDAIDNLSVTACVGASASKLPWGGCLFANLLWAQMRRKEPFEGPVVDGHAWYVGGALMFAKMGPLKFD